MLKLSIQNSFCGQHFRKMLVPATVAMAAEVATLFCCKVLAGHLISDDALSSITTLTPLFSLLLFWGACIAGGTTVCFTNAIGKLQKKEAAEYFGQGVVLSILVGVICCVVFAFAREPIFDLIGMPPYLMDDEAPFYSWFLAISVILPLCYYISELVHADGDGKISAIAYATLLIVQVSLSLFLAPRVGIAGLGAGMFFAFICFLLVLLVHFKRKKNSLHFRLNMTWKSTCNVFRYSIAQSSTFLCFSFFSFGLTYSFFHMGFPDSLPILAMIFEVIELGVVFSGIWLAAEPLESVYYSEGNTEGVRNVMRFVNQAILKEGVLMTILFIVFAPELAKVFHIHEQDTLPEAIFAVRIASVGLLAKAVQKVYSPYHQHHNPVLSMFIAVMNELLVPAIGCLVLAQFYGSYGFWVGIGLAPIVSLLLCSLYAILRYGWKHFPLLLHADQEAHWKNESVVLEPKSLMHLRDQFAEYLNEQKVERSIQNKVMLLIEELGMQIYELNARKKVWMEFSMCVKPKEVMCMMRDNGKLLDLTDIEMAITDLRAYFVTSFMSSQKEKTYVLTTSYNRHVFRFDRKELSQKKKE